MRRNRPRRPSRRLGSRARYRPGLRRLKLAHKLMESEDFSRAGVVFEELGLAALRRGIPRASQLFLQAGKAHIKAGNSPKGTELLLKGIRVMVKIGQIKRLPFVGKRILDGLRELGMDKEYLILESEINQLLSSMDLSLAHEEDTPSPAKLPPKCPYCGGTVHPNEVEWINEYSVMCDFCGSVVEEIA